MMVKISHPEDRFFFFFFFQSLNRVISDMSVVLRESTLTISDSIETVSPVEPGIVRVVSVSTTEITQITRLKKKIDLQCPYTLILIL